MSCCRLLRDLQELQRDPLPTINALPIDGNLLEWHANLAPPPGTSEYLVLHILLEFPSDYPSSPPVVSLATPIPHPNVLNCEFNEMSVTGMPRNFMCLDMLHNQDWYLGSSYHTERGSGWSPAYTVRSILCQLQSFLFQDRAGYGATRQGKIDRARDLARNFECACGHKHAACWPPIGGPAPEWEPKPRPQANTLDAYLFPAPQPPIEGVPDPAEAIRCAGSWRLIVELPEDLILLILDEIGSPSALHAALKSCKRMRELDLRRAVFTRRELTCFFSRAPFTEAVLGIGLRRTRSVASAHMCFHS
jgi:ubiquitin-protein ligase